MAKTKVLTVVGLVVSALGALDTWAISNSSALHMPPELGAVVMLVGATLASLGKSLTAKGTPS